MPRHEQRAGAWHRSCPPSRQGLGRTLLALLLLTALQLGSCSDAAAAGGSRRRSRTRVIVKLKQRAGGMATALTANKPGLKFRARLPSVNADVFDVDSNVNVDDVLSQLNAQEDVEYAEADGLATVNGAASVKPNDPLYPNQWHLPHVSAPQAWAKLKGSSQVKICHTDSGVRMGHPDLQAAVAMGWNFVPKDQSNMDTYNPVSPTDPFFRVYNDTFGHGTNTGGIITALTNNGRGVAGTGFGVKLLVCRFIWNDGSGWVSDAINCWKLCEEQGATIYSNSWGLVPNMQSLRDAMLEHQAKGHTMIFSAGNSGSNLNLPGDLNANYPVSYGYPCIIAVAASDSRDNLAYFSDYGSKKVHLAAPGVDILSTTNNGQYAAASGTSFSAPVVTGMAALMQSKALDKGIRMRYSHIKTLILNNVDRPAPLRGLLISNGRLNMERTANRFLVWYRKQKPAKVARPPPAPKHTRRFG